MTFKKGYKPPHTFQKGQSGNPGGRPKGLAELKSYASKYTQEAIDFMAEVMQGKPMKVSYEKFNPKTKQYEHKEKMQLPSPQLRMEAAALLVERALGKPVQPLSDPDGETPLQINKIVREIIHLSDSSKGEEQKFSRIIDHDPNEKPRARERLTLNGGGNG